MSQKVYNIINKLPDGSTNVDLNSPIIIATNDPEFKQYIDQMNADGLLTEVDQNQNGNS